MLGIRGLDAFGAVHTVLGLIALVCGAMVLLRAKGTSTHRRIGGVYVAAMTGLNATGLLIYDLYGHFGPFHLAALVSLATVAAGYLALYFRRPRTSWMEVHAIFFCWSYVGLWAAFVSEVVVRVPGVSFNTGAIGGSVVAVLVGAFLIHTRVPALAAQLRRRPIR
jgi:uncharacterized membrane protein